MNFSEKDIKKVSARMKRNNSTFNSRKRPAFSKYDWDVDSMEMSEKCFLGVRDCKHHDSKGFLTRHSVDMGRKKKKVVKRAPKPKPVKVAEKPEPQQQQP